MNDYLKLLLNRRFSALWLSQFLSQVAIHCLTFLIILKIFDNTGSIIATSLVWIIFILPAITIGPFAATFVDLVDRRKVLIYSNLLQALIIFLYSFAASEYLYLSYAVVLIYSIFNQFYIPAEMSALPIIVKDKYLARANGLFLITYQAALVVGFGVAGVVIETLGFHSAFLIASILVLISFFATLTLPKMKPEQEVDLYKLKFTEIFVHVFEGINHIKDRKEVLLPFLTIIGLQVTLPIVVVNLPIISQNVLGLSPHLSGITITAPAGLGATLGILFAVKHYDNKSTRKAVKESLTALVFSFWALLLVVPYIDMPYKIIISTLLFIMVGASFIGIFITAETELQINTPKRLLGRVFGNSWFFTSAGTILPMIGSATVVELIGIKALIGIIGVSLLIILLFYDRINTIKT